MVASIRYLSLRWVNRKDINLQVALKLKNLLEKSGVNVVMTRSSDVALDNLNDKSSCRHKRGFDGEASIL